MTTGTQKKQHWPEVTDGTQGPPRLALVTSGSKERRTRVGQTPSGGRATQTIPMSGADQFSSGGGSQGESVDTRRILGVMVTYSWRPEGQLFIVREGKNYIGRGRVSSEPERPRCDIFMPNDDRMSEEHALILCRHGRYDIIDKESANGTFVGDELLPTGVGKELENEAKIHTGSTVWSFIKIEPPEGVETRAAVQETTQETVTSEAPPPTPRPTKPVR